MMFRSALLIYNPYSYAPMSFNLCVVLLVHLFDRERAFLFLIYFSTLSVNEITFVASKCVRRNSGWSEVSMHPADAKTGHLDQDSP
jgi:hypothetical protein